MLFIIDFDGTVAPTDTVDALLQKFADPEWERLEQEWLNGTINSQQCMSGQLALVRGERAVLQQFLQSVQIDPSFLDFVAYARSFGEVVVVSDGLDYPIHCAFEKAGLDIPIVANRLHFGDCGLTISFPNLDAACQVKSGVCKCAVSRRIDGGRGLPIVLVGDGKSDQCLARAADAVFAKGTLESICRAEGIPYSHFDSFADVLEIVREWNEGGKEQENKCPLAASPM